MIPLLLLIGAGAALELRRLIHKPSNDVEELQNNERRLRQLLENVQKELDQEQRKHAEDVQRVEALRQEQERLKALAEDLQSSVEGLRTEKEGLSEQLKNVGLQGEATMSQLTELRTQIAAIVEKYLTGSLDILRLVEQLETFGVSMDITTQQLQELKAESSGSKEGLSLHLDKDWRRQMHLLMDDPHRMALRLAQSAQRGTLPDDRTMAIAFPKVRTPPKERQDARLPSLPGLASKLAGEQLEVGPATDKERPALKDGSSLLNMGHAAKATAEAAKPKATSFMPKVVLKKAQTPKLQLDVAEWSSPLQSKGVFIDSPSTDGTIVVTKKFMF